MTTSARAQDPPRDEAPPPQWWWEPDARAGGVLSLEEFGDAFSEDLLDLHEELTETLAARFAFRRPHALYPGLVGICHGIYVDDARTPFRARGAAVSALDLWADPDDSTPLCIGRRLGFGAWCFAHRDIVAGTYDAVVSDLLDPDRPFTHGYLERWARFLYGAVL